MKVGRVAGDTQTGCVLALQFGLIPEHLRDAAADRLVSDVRARGNRLSTGLLGVGLLLPVLSAMGRDDLAADLLIQHEFPSWLLWVRHGATTVYERWDGRTPATGPHPDHSIELLEPLRPRGLRGWLYSGIAGIRPDPARPGFGHVEIKPVLAPTLTRAEALVYSERGRMATRWSLENDTLTVRVIIPVGATASVYLPVADYTRAKESGRQLS